MSFEDWSFCFHELSLNHSFMLCLPLNDLDDDDDGKLNAFSLTHFMLTD